jgi:hypothetical protein
VTIEARAISPNVAGRPEIMGFPRTYPVDYLAALPWRHRIPSRYQVLRVNIIQIQ